MTYYESAAGATISKARAIREIEKHVIWDEITEAEFIAECGDRTEYEAQAVLAFLGY